MQDRWCRTGRRKGLTATLAKEPAKFLVDDFFGPIARIVMDADSKWYSGVKDVMVPVWCSKQNPQSKTSGIATGQKLKLRGKGNMSRDTHNAGDLFVLIDVAEHPLVQAKRGGFDLRVPLLFIEAASALDPTFQP